MNSQAHYDVFLSHNSKDKPAVEKLAGRLEDEEKLRPFLDKWHLIPGERLLEALEVALDQSKCCAVFLGPSGLGPWENIEMRAALEERYSSGNFRVIPVLLPGADSKDSGTLPRFLRSMTWVDFTKGLEDEDAFIQLVAGIRGVAPGRRPPVILPDTSLYVQKSIREMMNKKLAEESLDIYEYLRSPEATLRSVAKRCLSLYPGIAIEDVKKKLSIARSTAFGEKYAGILKQEDERYVDFESWEAELKKLLFQLGIIGFSNLKMINVGIGNGNEKPGFYKEFHSFTGVDISQYSLDSAKKVFPDMKDINADAENLKAIKTNSQDLYISLRTFQSSLFDLEEALFEMYRVLKLGGHCIISIPYKYYVNHKIMNGLLRGAGGELDLDLPYIITDKIRRGLNRLDFDSVGIHTGFFEIYTYGKKTR